MAEGIYGDGRDQRGIDAAAQAYYRFAEAAFVDVIASAADQRAIGDFQLVRRLAVDVAFAGCGVEEHQIFFEGFGLGCDAAVGHDGYA